MHIGTDGYLWSKSAGEYSSSPGWSSALHLGFGGAKINPSSGPNYRRNGFPSAVWYTSSAIREFCASWSMPRNRRDKNLRPGSYGAGGITN